MLKALRKYNKWILVIGGILLMLAFLVQPAINQLSGDPNARPWAKLDGRTLRARDSHRAQREIQAVEQLTFGLFPGGVGVVDRDVRHWVLLAHEASEGGFTGEAGDGAEFLPTLLAGIQMDQRFGNWRGLAESFPSVMTVYNQAVEQFAEAVPRMIAQASREHGLSESEIHAALSRLRGIIRMQEAYLEAARVSDRRAALTGRRTRDAAWVDYAFIPASVGIEAVPDPDEATLAAHVEKFKATKPGEGEFGVGYLLPERVRLEWLTLDAEAIEAAINPDPVAVNKRYLQDNKQKYKGDFAAERAGVVRDMKAERVAEVMQEAHRAIQAEVLKVTRRLEPDGRFKKLPADWAAQRPRFEPVAAVVVEQVKKALGVTIPLPTVTVRAADWVTRTDAASLDGIGFSAMQSGTLRRPFVEVVFGVRELRPPGAADTESTLAVQTGVPIVEAHFQGPDGDRFYVTVLDARRESAPDSLDEIRATAISDYKRIRAFEGLAARADEFRSLAVAEGVRKVVDLVQPPEAKPREFTPDLGEVDATNSDAGKPAPALRTRVSVTREQMTAAASDLGDVDVQEVRDAILGAAAALDPLAPPGHFDPATATVTVPVPRKLGVVVARITALSPLTREAYQQSDPTLESETRGRELMSEADRRVPRDYPFSLTRLLERHTWISDEPEEDEKAPGNEPVPPSGNG
ncbi:MAG: hypothetical protein ACKVU4_01945 [Phycisphaerales bacterium]